MDKEKAKKLEKFGWKIGDTEKFLNIKIKKRAYLIGHTKLEEGKLCIYHIGVYSTSSNGLTQKFDEILVNILESGEHDDYGTAKKWIIEYAEGMSKHSKEWKVIYDFIKREEK